MADDSRVDARTSNQVAGMSEQARVDLARQLNSAADAEYESGGSYRRGERPITREQKPRERRRSSIGTADDQMVASVSASLHRTERRLRLNGDKMSDGRKVRLGKRARRLKKQLNRLK